MTKTFIIDKRQKPTEEQLREVTGVKKHPIVFDEDAPELPPTMYKALKSSVIRESKIIEAHHLPINDMLPLF